MVITLPDVRQTDLVSCGAACAVAVCRYYGQRRGLHEVAESLHTSGMDGVDPRTIEAFFRCSGLHVLSGEMALDDLRSQARLKRPVVCVLRGHYVVAAGVHRGQVHFQDPLAGPSHLREGEFLYLWQETDRLGADYHQFGLSVWSE